MHPNKRYVDLYTDEFLEKYPEKKSLLHPHQLSIGLFSLTLGISQSLGLYQILTTAYEPKIANAILDYAMFNICNHSNVSELFASKMDRQMVFCVKPYEDSWYSNTFCHEMTDGKNALFCGEWLDLCLKTLCSKDVLISIDGSNIDCSSQSSTIVKHGKEKSNSGSMIVSFIWVICSSGEYKGVPLTYFVYEGNKVDCKALKKVMSRLKNHKVNVAGAILDRGFCTKDCVAELESQHIPFEIMMTSNTEGYTSMMNEYADTIFNHARYRLEGKPGKYGITSNDVKLMANTDAKACIGLFYDDINGAARRTAYIRDVEKEKERVYKAAHENPYDVKISRKYNGVLKFTGNADIVAIDDEALEIELHKKGYSAISSSKESTAKEIDDIYNLRDVAEKVFMEVKSQLGYDVIRGYETESIYNRFFACFIGCILRAVMINVCKKCGIDTNLMISDLDFLQYEYNGSNYTYSTSLSKVQTKIFSEFGLTNESLALLSEAVNERLILDVDSIHRPPARSWSMPEKKKPGRKPKKKPVTASAKLPVVSSGIDEKMGGLMTDDASDTNTTENPDAEFLEKKVPTSEQIMTDTEVPCASEEPVSYPNRERIPALEKVPEQEVNAEPPFIIPVKRKPGRPPGSKNKKTIDREKEIVRQAAAGTPPLMLPSARRGRPKSQAAQQQEEEEKFWRNKAAIAGVPLLELPKRTRGQPSKEQAKQRLQMINEWKLKVDEAYSKVLAH